MKKTLTDTLSKDTNQNMAPNGYQCFLGVVSLLVQKYFIHLCALQLSQENTRHLKQNQAFPSKPNCLYISKHRRAAVLLSGEERTLSTKTAAFVLPSWLYPVTFIHLLMPATIATKSKWKQLKHGEEKQMFSWDFKLICLHMAKSLVLCFGFLVFFGK